MLEALVSSRIRRTLLEYLVTHPNDRFYLRGLAKDLGQSISPLRRELKRLEQSGMLTAYDEGNMRFYTVHVNSPAFQELRQVGLPAPACAGPGTADRPRSVQSPVARQAGLPRDVEPTAPKVQAQPVVSMAPAAEPILVGTISASGNRQARHRPLPTPVMVGVTVVGLILMVGVATAAYLLTTNRQLASSVERALSKAASPVAVVTGEASNAGVMRGARWQIVPGGFGGFSAGTGTGESY